MSKLVVISGPSGAGKGTIVNELLNMYKKNNDKVKLSISYTTRSPREGEENGVNYHFISEEEFLEKINNHEFLEYNKYGTGKYYGTSKINTLSFLEQGYDVILEIDINGYKQILENYKEAVGIFVMPPSLEVLEERLRNRGTENDEQIKKRLETAMNEIKDKKIYPYVVINEDNKVIEAANNIYNIIKDKKF